MSAHAKAAKDALDNGVTDFERCKTRIKNALAVTPPNTRTVRSKMKLLTESLSNLNILHTAWVGKSGLSDEQLAEDRYSTTWLKAEWAEVDLIEDQVEELLIPLETRTDNESLSILHNQMETLQHDISTKTRSLLEKTAPPTDTSETKPNISATSHKIYDDMISSVQTSLSGEFDNIAEKIMSLDKQNVVTLCKDFEQFRRNQHSNIVTVQLRLADIISQPADSQRSKSVKSMEMEKSKAPVFSGKTIHYPEFKRGWQQVAGVHWDDANQVEQIKHKVDEKTRRIISRCKNMADVWKVLDEEFAQEQEVILAVEEELRKLRSTNCSVPEYIVELRNYLPTLEDALESVNGVDHLHSPDRVNYLTAKFDERTLHEWDYFRSKAVGTTYQRFYDFLQDRYDSCKTSIARSKSSTLSLENTTKGHVNHTEVVDATDCRRCKTWMARDNVHTCPGCGRGTAIGDRILHCLEHCGAYMQMTVDERSSCVENAKWCPVHLVGSHSLSDCNQLDSKQLICGVSGCKKHHHRTLHGSTLPFIANINTTQYVDETISVDTDKVMFSMQTIPSSNGDLNCLFDNCANCCLITRRAANELNLEGQPMLLSIRTAIGVKKIDSHLYAVPLHDKDNKIHFVKALEIESISDSIPEVDVSGVKHLFSSAVQSKWASIEQRPKGEFDILLGANVSSLHPSDHESRGNLKVLTSVFGDGLILTGTHPAITSQNINWNEDVYNIRHFSNIRRHVSVLR